MTTLAKHLPLVDAVEKTNEPIRQVCPIQVIKQAKTGGTIRISTSSYDRENDRVFPRGGQLANYLANPIVQWGHQYELPWQTIGRTLRIDVQDEWIDVEFELRPAANEHDPQNIVLLLWEGGWIKTASIGFKPLKVKGNDRSAYDFLEWELLEWSLVPIPANQEALRLAMKSFTQEKELFVPILKELSLNALVEAVWTALYRTLYSDAYWDSDERIDQYPVAVYASYAIVRVGLSHYRVEYTIEEGRVVLQAREAWTIVEETWVEGVGDSTLAKALTDRLIAHDPRRTAAPLLVVSEHKAGARHSKADSAAIQAIHDSAVALGATCETDSEEDAEEKSATPAEIKNDHQPEPEQDVAPLLDAIHRLKRAAHRAA